MEVVFGVQRYVLINGEHRHCGRPRIFYGINAEKVSNNYIEEYAEINGYVEIKKGDFNERLFQDRQFFVELFKLDCEYFVHNCN